MMCSSCQAPRGEPCHRSKDKESEKSKTKKKEEGAMEVDGGEHLLQWCLHPLATIPTKTDPTKEVQVAKLQAAIIRILRSYKATVLPGPAPAGQLERLVQADLRRLQRGYRSS